MKVDPYRGTITRLQNHEAQQTDKGKKFSTTIFWAFCDLWETGGVHQLLK